MQHLMVGDKSLLIGDEIAELLLQYAALVGRTGRADTVHIDAFDSEGNETRAGLLLNAGTSLVTETSHSTLQPPDNAATEAELRERLANHDIDRMATFGLDMDDPE